MAVLLNANTDALTRSDSVPSETAFTITAWIKRAGNGGAVIECAVYIRSDPINQIPAIMCSGGQLVLNDAAGGEHSFFAVSNGVWYFVAMACGATGTTALKGYAATGSNALTAVTGNMGAFNQQVMGLGYANADVWFNGTIGAVKVWDAALTQSEIEQERWQYLPNRSANLHLFSPFINTGGTSFLDISGNGRNWTEAGTVTDEDGPPIPWKMGRSRVLIPAAAAGGSIVPLLMHQYRSRRQ